MTWWKPWARDLPTEPVQVPALSPVPPAPAPEPYDPYKEREPYVEYGRHRMYKVEGRWVAYVDGEYWVNFTGDEFITRDGRMIDHKFPSTSTGREHAALCLRRLFVEVEMRQTRDRSASLFLSVGL